MAKVRVTGPRYQPLSPCWPVSCKVVWGGSKSGMVVGVGVGRGECKKVIALAVAVEASVGCAVGSYGS